MLVLHHAIQIQRLEDGRVELSLTTGEAQVLRMAPQVAMIISLFDGARSLAAVQEEAARHSLRVGAERLAALANDLKASGFLVPVEEVPRQTLPKARVTCAGCTDCCHLLGGPMSEREISVIEALDWDAHGVTPPSPWLQTVNGERAYLAQTETDACVFLQNDGLCLIHKHFGAEAKPSSCRLFPIVPIRRAGVLRLGVSFECPSQHLAVREGESLQEAGEKLEQVIAEATRGWPMLPDVDPGEDLWRCVVGPPAPNAPFQAAIALCRTTAALPPGDKRLPDLLTFLAAQMVQDPEVSERVAQAEDAFRVAIEALCDEYQSNALQPLPTLDGDASNYLLDYLKNQVYLGEPAGRLGIGVGVSVWALACILGVRLAAAHAGASCPLSAEATALGLSQAVAGLRCLDLVPRLSGFGSIAVGELERMLSALLGSSPRG